MKIRTVSKWFSSSRVAAFLAQTILLSIIGLSPKLFAASQPSISSVDPVDNGYSGLLVTLIIIGVLALGAFIVYAITSWGKKQDDIDNMMTICIKYFFNTKNEDEKCKAASALGRTKNTGALLVLIDVISDEKVEKKVQKTAEKSLAEMGSRNRKYKTLIDDVTAAIKNKDHRKVIDILVSNFEKNRRGGYAQSAYVIGREYIRLGQYDAGRNWLTRAQARNRKYDIYGNQIALDINRCNQYLFNKGDSRLSEGDYYAARELYTLASTGIGEMDKKRFAAYLRMACAYCKVGDYVDADQAILQALQHHHKTDLSLRLNKLITRMLQIPNRTGDRKPEVVMIEKEIDRCVSDIINILQIPSSSSNL